MTTPKHILCGVDIDHDGMRVEETAWLLARAIGADTTFLYVDERTEALRSAQGLSALGIPDAAWLPEIREERASDEASLLARVRAACRSERPDPTATDAPLPQGARIRTMTGFVDTGLLQAASSPDAQCDLVVVGRRRPSGLGQALLGTVASGLLSDTPVPLLVVPEWHSQARWPWRHIVLATSLTGAPHAHEDFALELATALGARVTLAHVDEDERLPEGLGLLGRAVPPHAQSAPHDSLFEDFLATSPLDRLEAKARSLEERHPAFPKDRLETWISSGTAAEGLVRAVRSLEADVVVVGLSSKPGLRRGRLVRALLENATPVPVFGVPHISSARQ